MGLPRYSGQPHLYVSYEVVSEGLDDREELLCREGGTTDQPAIDIGLGEELRRILTIAGATVEDRGLLSDLLAVAVGDRLADILQHLLCLLARGSLTGADRPDRLVGDDDTAELVLAEIEDPVLELLADDVKLPPVLALLEVLTAAEDHLQPVVECLCHLGDQSLGVLAVVLAALAVAEDDRLSSGAGYHGCGDLTGVGALGLGGAILCRHDDVGALDRLSDSAEVGKGYAEDDVALAIHALESLANTLR